MCTRGVRQHSITTTGTLLKTCSPKSRTSEIISFPTQQHDTEGSPWSEPAHFSPVNTGPQAIPWTEVLMNMFKPQAQPLTPFHSVYTYCFLSLPEVLLLICPNPDFPSKINWMPPLSLKAVFDPLHLPLLSDFSASKSMPVHRYLSPRKSQGLL